MWKVKNKRPEDEEEVRKFYDEEEVKRYKNLNSMRRIQQRILLKIFHFLGIDDLIGKRVLDIGCGTGFTMELVESLGGKIFGIDVSSAMLKHSDFKGKVFLGDAREMGLKDDVFDYIFAVSSIQWFTQEKQDVKKFRDECYRVLKNNGRFGFQFYPKSFEEAKQVFRIFSKKFKCELIIENEKSKKKRLVFLLGEKV